jgi:hypothetical protein
MISEIRQAALEAGVTAMITNSTEKIETQLNRLTGNVTLPLMLISWDIESSLEFNEHGFLMNPRAKIVALLMTKAVDTSKEEAEVSAELMAALFQVFLKKLYDILIPYQKVQGGSQIISDIGFTLVPLHGAGKHSGVLGRFTMEDTVSNC